MQTESFLAGEFLLTRLSRGVTIMLPFSMSVIDFYSHASREA